MSKGIVYNTSFLPGDQFLMCSDSLGMLKIYDTKNYQLKASVAGGSFAADSFKTSDEKIHIVTG